MVSRPVSEWSRDVLDGYAAGIIDGEGCISIKKVANGYTPYVEVGQNSNGWAMMDFLRDRYGATLSSIIYPPGNRKPQKLAFWTGPPAHTLLTVLSPYLLIKTEQARLALDFYEKMMAAKLLTHFVWKSPFKLEADKMYEQMKAMNKKGRIETDPALCSVKLLDDCLTNS